MKKCDLQLQALKEGRLRAQALQPDERMRRPGLSTLVLDEADLMLSMPGYEEDLQAIAPLVHPCQMLCLLRQNQACYACCEGSLQAIPILEDRIKQVYPVGRVCSARFPRPAWRV